MNPAPQHQPSPASTPASRHGEPSVYRSSIYLQTQRKAEALHKALRALDDEGLLDGPGVACANAREALRMADAS